MLYLPMKNTTYTTPMLPGINLRILRQKPRSEQQKLAERIALLRQKSFKQIGFAKSFTQGNDAHAGAEAVFRECFS
jgi:hypothetical protein